MNAQPVSVGIVANPASGSDIRRLVALGSTFGTQDKIDVVRRILAGLAAMEVEHVYLMPDAFRIGATALSRLPAELAGLRERAVVLDTPVENCADDSRRAAREMVRLGVGCIVVLGGDGTCRAVAKGCGPVPILPISTGTNNVVPYVVEGTIAGLAAGFVAARPEIRPQVAYRSKWLEVQVEGRAPDVALVDVAVVEGVAVGSRAIWQPQTLRQAILARAEPTATGISSLGGFLAPIAPPAVTPPEPRGLYLRFGEPRVCRVTAPLAPGLVASLGVEEMRELRVGDSVTVPGGGQLLALDGEREIPLNRGQVARVCLRDDGPWIVEAHCAVTAAVAEGRFVQWSDRSDAPDHTDHHRASTRNRRQVAG